MHQSSTRQYVWQFLNDYAFSLGIRIKIGTHTLRKTFGYHAFNNGVDLSLLVRIFNHSSQEITLRYIGITQEQVDDVYVNLDKVYHKISEFTSVLLGNEFNFYYYN